MLWLTMLAEIDAGTASNVADWVKIGAGGLTIGGLIWACIYVARTLWKGVLENMVNDIARLRKELADNHTDHRTEIDSKELLISKKDDLIDRLRQEIRSLEGANDAVQDDNRELRFENTKLRDQGKGTP